MSARLLMIDDDTRLSAMVGDYLRGAGYKVEVAASLAQGRERLAAEAYDALVLDLMLPDGDGLDLCRELRNNPRTRQLPLLMLTARGEPMDRIVGLELGADDYLPKPFEPRELVARIRAVLRGGPGPAVPPVRVRIGGWTFDRVQRRLQSPEGVVTPLSAAEHRLLVAFIDHPGQALSRERLLDLSRAPGVDASERSIDLAVSRLRAKFGGTDGLSGPIRTLRGMGYVFQPLEGAR